VVRILSAAYRLRLSRVVRYAAGKDRFKHVSQPDTKANIERITKQLSSEAPASKQGRPPLTNDRLPAFLLVPKCPRVYTVCIRRKRDSPPWRCLWRRVAAL